MGRCSCGRDLGPDDRFCSRCGLAVAAASAPSRQGPAGTAHRPPSEGLLFEQSIGPTETLLLNQTDPDTATASTESQVSSSTPVRWIILGLAAAGLLMWGLYAWPRSEVEVAGDEPGLGEDGQDPGARSDSEPDDAGSQEPREDPDGDRARRSDRSANDDGGGSSEEDQDRVEDRAGPVVGEVTGLGLVIGSFDGGRSLELVVLDTGEIFELPNLRGRPVGRIGNTLIAADFGEVLALDLATPDGEPETIVDFVDGWIQTIEVDGDLIRTIQDDESGARLLALTLDGELVEEVDLLMSSFAFGWPRTNAGGDIVQSGSGGVYRRAGDSYRRLSTGRIRAAGQEIVLVEECDDQLRCQSTWYDQQTWDPVGLPAPSLPPDATGLVGGGDRWLITTDWRTNSTGVIDIESGRSVRDMEGNRFFGHGSTSPVSDDGRWLVDRDGIDSVVVDLGTGTEWPLDVSLLGETATMWIEVAGTAFEG